MGVPSRWQVIGSMSIATIDLTFGPGVGHDVVITVFLLQLLLKTFVCHLWLGNESQSVDLHPGV